MRKQALAAVAAITLGAPMTAVLSAGTAAGDLIATATPKERVCRPTTARKGITVAFNQFLAAPSAADKVQFVDRGAKIHDAVDKSDQVALASGRAKPPLQDLAVNLAVTCTTKTKATFTYDLQIRQSSTGVTTPPLGLHQPGDAVLKKGTWYVTAPTACAFTALNPDPANQPAVAECYEALGQPVPARSS